MKNFSKISVLLGFFLVFSFFLVNLKRSFVPSFLEDFNLHFSCALFLFSFFILVFSTFLWVKGSLNPQESFSWPWLEKLFLLWRRAPGDFYRFLSFFYPDTSFMVEFRLKILLQLSLWDPRNFSFPFCSLVFFIPQILPPLFFFLETTFSFSLFYFYYSLLLLWLPLLGNFLIFYFLEYSSWAQSVLQKEFALVPRGSGHVISFFKNHPGNGAKAAHWQGYHLSEKFLQSLILFRQKYTPPLFFLRSLLYSLGWLQIILGHPSLSQTLSLSP